MDIRESIFACLDGRRFSATLTAVTGGVLCGVAQAAAHAEAVGLQIAWMRADGDSLAPGTAILTATGSAHAIAAGEERLPGCLSKTSGIATAAQRAMELAGGRARVVSGAWKKMPPELKPVVRHAVAVGGMPTRILDEPFVYLDKNYVRMLGGIVATLAAVRELPGAKVVQVRGEEASVAEETARACRGGASVVMVDTGVREDACVALTVAAAYPGVQVAFAGGIQLADIPGLVDLGVHILDIGTAIVDAALLDMKLDVTGVES